MDELRPASLATMAAIDWVAALAFLYIIAATSPAGIAMTFNAVPASSIPPVPLLPPEYHWAKRSKAAENFHIADTEGLLICDHSRSVWRSVGEPASFLDIHRGCLTLALVRAKGAR